MGWGIEGYIELKPDWKGSLEAITAAAADGAGGVGVDGEPTGSDPLPDRDGVIPPPLPLLLLLAIACACSAAANDDGVKFAPFPLDGVPLCDPPLSCDERMVLPPLPPLEPGSRFWFRNFSSRRHFARRLENQTFRQKMNKKWFKIWL